MDKKELVEKAEVEMVISLVLFIISLLTYVMPLIAGVFDYGIIFELIGAFFMFSAITSLHGYSIQNARAFSSMAFYSCGFLFLDDVWRFVLDIISGLEVSTLIYEFFIGEFFSILILLLVNDANRKLAKCTGISKINNVSDNFYNSNGIQTNTQNNKTENGLVNNDLKK